MNRNKVVTGESKLANAISSDIYVTILIEYNNGESKPYNEVYFRINGIRADAQNALCRIAKINTTDIDEQINKCTSTLQGYDNATYASLISGEYSGGAIGQITLGA